jgi:hypothetical protein
MESDKIDRYREIVLGRKNGTEKQRASVARFRHAFTMICEGYTPLQTAQNVMETFDVGQTMALRIIRDAIAVFGDANKFSKRGMKVANYERLMKLAQRCEERGEFSTARLLIKDANELLGLTGDDDEHLENPNEWMRPDGFIIVTDPKALENASKIIEVETEDAEVIDDEETEGASPDNLPDTQTS